MKTSGLSQDVQDEFDFTSHYRVADTTQFLDRLLPVKKSTVNDILHYMKKNQMYDSQMQRWKSFPDPTLQESGTELMDSEAEENVLYVPFCAIAEAIRGFVEAQVRPSASEMGSSKWVDYHDAQLKPGALFALQQTGLIESQVRTLS